MMGKLSRLFRRSHEGMGPQHSVEIALNFAGPNTDHAYFDEMDKSGRSWPDVITLEAELEDAVAGVGGEVDGNAMSTDEVLLYLIGPDAEALLRAALPVLSSRMAVPEGSTATMWYGDPTDDSTHSDRVVL